MTCDSGYAPSCDGTEYPIMVRGEATRWVCRACLRRWLVEECGMHEERVRWQLDWWVESLSGEIRRVGAEV